MKAHSRYEGGSRTGEWEQLVADQQLTRGTFMNARAGENRLPRDREPELRSDSFCRAVFGRP